MNLKCFECGAGIPGDVWTIGEFKFLSPVFCSEECADDYDEAELTLEKLKGISAWMRPQVRRLMWVPSFGETSIDPVLDDLRDRLSMRCTLEYRWEGPLWF